GERRPTCRTVRAARLWLLPCVPASIPTGRGAVRPSRSRHCSAREHPSAASRCRQATRRLTSCFATTGGDPDGRRRSEVEGLAKPAKRRGRPPARLGGRFGTGSPHHSRVFGSGV